MQSIPKFDVSSSPAIACAQRSPAWISLSDTHGFACWTIKGIQSFKAFATALLRFPLQLIKTFNVGLEMLLTADHCKQFKGEMHPIIHNLELLSITELWHGMFFSKYMSNFGATLGIRNSRQRQKVQVLWERRHFSCDPTETFWTLIDAMVFPGLDQSSSFRSRRLWQRIKD